MLIAKLDAAASQLDTAIRLLFKDGDPSSIRTLAGASATILFDIAENAKLGESWRSRMESTANQMGVKNFACLLNGPSNFLKHADRDPTAALDLVESETDDLMFVATLELGPLRTLSIPMQAFQVWYFAVYGLRFPSDFTPAQDAMRMIPGLNTRARKEQIRRGAKILSEAASVLPQHKTLERDADIS